MPSSGHFCIGNFLSFVFGNPKMSNLAISNRIIIETLFVVHSIFKDFATRNIFWTIVLLFLVIELGNPENDNSFNLHLRLFQVFECCATSLGNMIGFNTNWKHSEYEYFVIFKQKYQFIRTLQMQVVSESNLVFPSNLKYLCCGSWLT